MISNNGTVLITGASSGIGFALCEKLAPTFSRFIIVSSNSHRLKKAADKLKQEFPAHDFIPIPCDLSNPDRRKEFISSLSERAESIQLLVNNAGIGLHGAFAQTDPDAADRLIQLNLIAPVELSRWFLSQSGHDNNMRGIINIISMAAFFPGPNMALYYASKSFMHSFFSTLPAEDYGLKFLNVYPGPVYTDFLNRAGMHDSKAFRLFAVSAERIARETVRAWHKGKRKLIPGKRNQLLYLLGHCMPHSLTLWLQKKAKQ